VPARAAVAPLLVASLALLSACGDGGAAGDVDNPFDPFAASPIEPFVGVWNVTGHGNRFVNDQAFMIIRPIGEDGTAGVRIQEFDEQRLCYLRDTGSGRVETAAGSSDERIFMNGVILFDAAELTLSPSEDMLDILYFDTDDVDGDNDAGEQLSFIAPRALQADIDPLCEP